MSAIIRIQEAADRLGVSIDTLRRYERQGVIPPARRNPGRQRVYTVHDLEHLQALIAPETRQERAAGTSL